MTTLRADAPANVLPGFLALGDSYTIGEGVEPDGRWPVQLAQALRGEGLAIGEGDSVVVGSPRVQGASVQTIPVVRHPVNTARPPVNARIRCRDQSETDGPNLRGRKAEARSSGIR